MHTIHFDWALKINYLSVNRTVSEHCQAVCGYSYSVQVKRSHKRADSNYTGEEVKDNPYVRHLTHTRQRVHFCKMRA